MKTQTLGDFVPFIKILATDFIRQKYLAFFGLRWETEGISISYKLLIFD